MKRYKITGMGKGFDGLVVEGEMRDWTGEEFLEVVKITDESELFGDRNISVPVPKCSLYVNKTHLSEVEEKPREYAHDNPYGKFMYMSEYQDAGQTIVVQLTRFEKCVCVTVQEIIAYGGYNRSAATKYSQNFWNDFDQIEQLVKDAAGTRDLDDLVFKLKKLEGK